MSMSPQPALMLGGSKAMSWMFMRRLRICAPPPASTPRRVLSDARLCKVGHIAEQIVELGLQAAGQGRCRSAGRTDRKCRQQQSLLEGEFFH